MSGTHLSDEELVAKYRAQAGSPRSEELIGELFGRHYGRVALWCLRLTGNRESAADLAQDVFVRAYRHLGSYQGNSRFSTWLYSIVRNRFLDQARAQSETSLRNGAAEGGDPHTRVEKEPSVRVLRQLIRATLTETEKRVLYLHYGEDIPLDAVTRLLGFANTSGAKAYVVSARRKLSRALERARARQQRQSGLREVG